MYRTLVGIILPEVIYILMLKLCDKRGFALDKKKYLCYPSPY